jgi:RNA polymerase sigma-70 factor, ECF subfamily
MEPDPVHTAGPLAIRDSDLLESIATGDLEAFHLFYRRHAGRVLAFARNLVHTPCGSRVPAEDIVQEVFLAVWRKAGTYRTDRGDALGWLYTLTRNKAIDGWRRIDAEPHAAGAPEIPETGEHGRGELRLILRQALARLRPEQREAIGLAYFGDLTYEETAGRLALPVGTLKSRIRVGLREMRAILA